VDRIRVLITRLTLTLLSRCAYYVSRISPLLACLVLSHGTEEYWGSEGDAGLPGACSPIPRQLGGEGEARAAACALLLNSSEPAFCIGISHSRFGFTDYCVRFFLSFLSFYSFDNPWFELF